MLNIKFIIKILCFTLVITNVVHAQEKMKNMAKGSKEFVVQTESFSDKKILRYQVPGFDKLTLLQKELVVYLGMAGLAGRDIDWAQKHRFNIPIRKALEKIITNDKGNHKSNDWKAFELYTKQVWFSNGIHHHYSGDKFIPGFSKTWFQGVMKKNMVKLFN